MLGLRGPELIFIVVLLVVFFGIKKLPQLGKNLGEGIKEFRKAGKEIVKGIDDESE